MMQVDGFSLEAQRNKLYKYAEINDLEIAGEYSDEGKSGKSINGRPEFKRMLKDIEEEKDRVVYVLCFKLSRFGRSVVDTLNALNQLKNHGVNLICTEDGINSSSEMGKLLIAIMASIAEMERENILVQTMAGRKQKAYNGLWNGGQAPYGYTNVDGILVVNEEEAPLIREIFDTFVNTNMGANGIANYFDKKGIRKNVGEKRIGGEVITANYIKLVLDNPVYMGKIAYGRRKVEMVNQGDKIVSHKSWNKDYILVDGKHEAIVSPEVWEAAHRKRERTGHKRERMYDKERVHLLTGVLECPVCGRYMNANVTRRSSKHMTSHYYAYRCRHSSFPDNNKCSFKNQISQDKIDEPVISIIRGIVQNNQYAGMIKAKLDLKSDTKELVSEISAYEKRLRQLENTKNTISKQIDSLDYEDNNYERKFLDFQKRLDDVYDKIYDVSNLLEECKVKKYNADRKNLTVESVYQYLKMFDKLYEKMTSVEKKKLVSSLVEKVQIFEEQEADGNWLKSVKFNFPVFVNDKGDTMDEWVKHQHVECACLLSRKL